MCLSVPAKIVRLEGQQAQVEVYSQSRTVTLTCPDAKVGDWVLLYGNVALAVLDSRTAHETLSLLKPLHKPDDI